MQIGFLALLALVYVLTQMPKPMVAILGSVALAITAVAIFEKRRRRADYAQMLRDFRWCEDITPLEFEEHCADYLRLHGWRATLTKGSGDQGVDVFAVKAGVRVVLQCKKYNSAVGNKAVQEAYTGKAYADADRAAVVTNATFTPAARELASKTGLLLLHFSDLGRADTLFGVAKPSPGARA